MQIRRVRAEEDEIDRYVGECWFPYHADLGEAVADHALAEDVDREAVVDHYLDVLDSPSDQLWVALDGADDPTASLSTVDAAFAGFVRTSVDHTPPPFEWPPDRVRIRDLWVDESYRGTGVADELVERARRQAHENGCERLDLVVGTDNERAVAYVERLGFETRNLGLRVPLADVRLAPEEAEGALGNGSSPQLRRVRVDEATIRRFLEECWVPFWRDIGSADGRRRLSEDLDRDHVVEEFLDTLDDPEQRAWVALDDVAEPTADLADVEAVFAGWLAAGLAPSDPFVDQPKRLSIARLYVAPEYRGEGLADRIMERALQYAREEGCAEFSLGVGVDNDRARGYYEKLGFEPYERRLSVGVDDVEL